MRKYLYDTFKLNVSYSTVKTIKRLVLEKLEGSYIDEFNKLKAYAQELRESDPGTDVIINISKEALDQGKRRLLRMYVCIQALKNGWKAVKSNGDQGYGVVEGEDTYVVHIGRKKRTCRTWDLTGIPCPHAIKVYIHDNTRTRRSCKLVLNGSIQSVQDVSLSAPQDSQESGVVMPTLDCVAPLCAVADTDGDESKKDEQPTIQPKRISEAKTRLEAKKVSHRPTGTRKIGFKGDENGVSIPTNILYSPKMLTYKGNTTMTLNQLNVEKEKNRQTEDKEVWQEIGR
ncbi:hypothetical protein BC332_21232 [Capsicum chinense]|nr:hypothetical protein BC332_21232 [Capsicum chinense]